MSGERPRTLFIVDAPNWAHDRKTDALAQWLAPSYDVRKRYQREVVAEDLLSADAVLVYYWLQIDRLPALRSVFDRIRERLLIGVCSHNELQGAWEAPGIEMLSSLPRAVFANSRLLQKAVAPTLGREVYYAPNGVDTAFFQPAPAEPRSERPLRVGWAGSLSNHPSEHRGVNEFILPAVRAIGGEARMAIREEKWRDRDEMRSFHQSIDVYVCASRSEGTPNGPLEAAASGVPVVTTRVGSMPELIRDGENGYFVERDADAIAQKLRVLRDDPELRHRLGRAARVSVEAWDWRHQAANYDAMLRHIL